MQPLLFRNAHLVTAEVTTKADVLVDDGKIVAMGEISYETLKKAELTETEVRTIDCMGMHLLPGAIDMHVHFRDPGFTHKEDFATGSLAAASGGVTTIVDMPNTDPQVTTIAALEEKRKIAQAKSIVNAYFYFGATQNPPNVQEMRKALAMPDVLGVKICMAKTTGDLLVDQYEALEIVLKITSEADSFAIVHAEDNEEIESMSAKLAGAIDPRTHSLIRNPMTAYAATKRIIHLAKKIGARIHITHLSTALEVDELRRCAHLEAVSADCTPHHLFLTDDAYTQWGNMVKVNPPLRFDEDKEALWQALHEGLIQCIATDHAPHLRHEKFGNYESVPSGIPGVETMLPLLLDAVNHGQLTLAQVVQLTAQHPGKILGLKSKGFLEVGYDADLVLVDMNKKQKIGEHGGPHNGYYSKSGWSPFEGKEVHGWPIMTIVKGEIVWQN